MAETVRIRSIALPLTLLALASCAAQADVLVSDVDGGALASAVDAAIGEEARPGYRDAEGVAPLDTGTMDAGGDAAWYEERPPLGDAGRLLWTDCNPAAGQILDRGKTGDPCTFPGGCSRAQPPCGRRTALCADLVLHIGELSKDECVPDDPARTARCAAPADAGTCCIEMWECNAASELRADDQAVATICALDCETGMFPKSEPPLTKCKFDPLATELTPPWPPSPGTPCQGSFICDSDGYPAGPDTAWFSFDAYGRIYWCDEGVIQRVATGPSLPWNP